MFWRSLRLACACALISVVAAPACGGNATDPHASSAGSAGSGGNGHGASPGSGSSGNDSLARAGSAAMNTEMTAIPCGSRSCTGTTIPIQNFTIPACCADAKTGQCGLDSSLLALFGPSFTEACQPLAQPGTPDASCPSSASTPVTGTGLSITFPGCCRPNHSCGYELNTIAGVFQVGLGCVDATPFLNGGMPQACGDVGVAGAGGDSGGIAGAGGDSGEVAGTGGDSSSAGAAG